MLALLEDLRHALRALRARPGFALVVVLTMAVGIGANVAFFAYLSYLVWPTMQAPEPDRLVWLHDSREDQPRGSTSYGDWQDLRDAARCFDNTTTWRFYSTSVAADDRAHHAWGHAVGGDFFGFFGARPELGRLLRADDDRPGAEPVVVLHHFFWRKYFASDPSIIGRTIKIDARHPYTVVGVTRRGFQGSGVTTGIYLPLGTATWLPSQTDRTRRNAIAIARLRQGIDLEAAAAELRVLSAGLDAAYPEEQARNFIAMSIRDANDADAESLVLAGKALMAAVVLLLVLACANIANLMLAQATDRQRDLAIHAALGADRWRLGRRILIECLLLSTAGGALGLAISARIQGVIVSYLLQTVPIGFGDWAVDTTIVADTRLMTYFFVGTCILTGLLFGVLPARAVARTDLVAALKGGAPRGGGRRRADQALVVLQIAVSVLLLLGAGLMARTAGKARSVALGFEPRGLEIAALFVATADRAGEQVDGKARYEQILAGARSLPGVSAATLVNIVPLSGGTRQVSAHQEDDQAVRLNYTAVATDYFETLGLAILGGRTFVERDGDNAPLVGIVNQSAAARLWPDQSPIGKLLRIEEEAPPRVDVIEVVGVVADSRYRSPTREIESLIYLPYQQRFHRRMTLLARTRAPIERPLRDFLAHGFPEVSVIEVVPFGEQVRRATAEHRMNADLAGGFGLLGLLLAALGIFSITSFRQARRTREIGIRMALGADRQRIARLVLGEVARLAVLGVVIGLGAAMALARLIRGLLYGVGTLDPPTLVAVPLVLAAVALLAAALPTRRAARVDPLAAIRAD